MRSKTKAASRKIPVRLLPFLAFAALAIAGAVIADERIGKVQQGLVGGDEVSEKTQEAYGLLELRDNTGSCTASLLRNDWAISAAHCVEATDANDNPMKDPSRPGQNILNPIKGFKIKALWGGVQKRKALRIETFRPYDVSLIQLDKPISVNGNTTGYVREVFWDQFPYFGSPGGAQVKVFGRGINQFAFGKGASAVPSSSDDKFRTATFRVSREEANLFWYPSESGKMVAGGDSGGPSFIQVGSTYPKMVLAGVHALTHAVYVPGKPTNGWDWVTATTEAADAPIKPVWKQIEAIMGPLNIKPPDPDPYGHKSAVFENTVPFDTKTKADDFFILYGVKQDGDLMWQRHIMSGTNPIKHSWNPPARVGNGWLSGVKDVLPAGSINMYALRDDGTLTWFRHLGSINGTYNWTEPSKLVGTGWNTFTHIIPMDKGVIYGITQDGYLRWHQHLHYIDGNGGVNGWASPVNVGWGWNDLDKIFGGGNGVLYVVKKDGSLMWYKHKAYLNPVAIPANSDSNAVKLKWQNSWEEPKKVGTGWGSFTKLFSPGEGYIYGIDKNGDLKWYHHLGWATGRADWDPQGGKVIATGWDSYAFAFARNTTSDAGSRDPAVDVIVH